jgi:hypothetical protein
LDLRCPSYQTYETPLGITLLSDPTLYKPLWIYAILLIITLIYIKPIKAFGIYAILLIIILFFGNLSAFVKNLA